MRGPDGNYKGTDSLGLLSKSQESFCQENLLSPFSGDQSPGFVFWNTMNQVEFVMDSFLSDLLSPSRICYFHLPMLRKKEKKEILRGNINLIKYIQDPI